MISKNDAILSAIRTFKPGPENLTQREWDDAVKKLEASLTDKEGRCIASPVGGATNGYQCELRKGHGEHHLAVLYSQAVRPDGSVDETYTPFNWQEQPNDSSE